MVDGVDYPFSPINILNVEYDLCDDRMYADSDTLHFELWDMDVANPDDLIGSVDIKMSTIHISDDNDESKEQKEDKEHPVHTQRVAVQLKSAKLSQKHDTTITFRVSTLREHGDGSNVERKTIFFIRHGESEWNSAQHKKQLHKMYKQIDHPLNEEGITQALHLNECWKEQRDGDQAQNAQSAHSKDSKDFTDFMASQIIYTSPLCRATQTAILSLLDHPCLESKGLCYARNLREIKTAGGADTMANKTGMEQFEKATSHILEHRPALKEKVDAIQINLNDAQQKWWTASVETQYHRRLEDFLYFIRFTKEDNVICVGHSLWFKGLFKRYADSLDDDHSNALDMLEENNPIENEEENMEEDVIQLLSKKKVQNAGCVRVDFDFSDEFQRGVKIADARLLFGTRLV